MFVDKKTKKNILLLRSKKESGWLKRRLLENNCSVRCQPVIDTRCLYDHASLQNLAEKINKTQAIAFTSKNAVRYFCQVLKKSKINLEALAEVPHWYAVGASTANYCQKVFARQAVVEYPKNAHGSSTLAEHIVKSISPVNILLPSVAGKENVLCHILRENGFSCQELSIYETVMLNETKVDSLGNLDAVVFF